MRSSPERRQRALVALAVGAVALGVLAESQGFAWSETRTWVPDLLAGWTLAGLGLAAAATARPAGLAVLLLTAGLAWFAGDFHSATPGWLGSLATDLSWVFLAPLVQLALAYPSGRPGSRASVVVVAAVWLLAATQWIDLNDETTLAVALTGPALVGVARAARERDKDGFVGLGALLLLVAWALAVPRFGLSVRPIAFDAGVAFVGALLYLGTHGGTGLVDRAIEVDESAGTLRGALAEVLRDPELEVGFPNDGGAFVDELDRIIGAPSPGRRTTELTDASGVVGVVVHDPRLLTSPRDREAVAVAVALAGTRDRMRRALRRQAEEISQSTVRLIRAGDDERRRLSARLDAGVRPQLDQAAGLLARASVSSSDPELTAAIERARTQVGRAESEVAAFAGGLGVPALLGTLPSAIGGLVEGLPFEVELRVADVDCSSELAATIWFVCSEGVANVLKHAAASSLVIEIAADERAIFVVVEDDGRGGADARGSGLAGLRDRATALGGSLRVEPRTAGGTRLVASLPRSVTAP